MSFVGPRPDVPGSLTNLLVMTENFRNETRINRSGKSKVCE